MVYAYTTHELVQAELQLSSAFSTTTLPSYDDVDEWIGEESAYINALANTVFGSTLYSSEMIDYDGEEWLILENAPVISVTSVQYNSNPLGSTLGSSWTTKSSGVDYETYKDRGALRVLFNNWRPVPGAKRICVTYSAGYTTVPMEVRKLTTKLVAERILNTLIQKNINERADGGSVSVGSISIVEPTSYGVSSYKQLKLDIEMLKKDIVNGGTTVYRFAHI
jgi:hypothetical protein